ncbi:MAG TPA: MFS transporter [Jatrophihabitantaceae bacterium]|jgi:MFS family permease|nr:MFS transporter [Jatrophihabitantaceae bacterium]
MTSRFRAELARWQVALIAGLVLGLVFGLIEGYSIFSVAFAHDLRLNRGQASSMYAAYLLTSAVAAPPAGRVVDRFGPSTVVRLAFPALALALGLCAVAVASWQMYGLYLGLVAPSTTLLIMSSQVLVNNSYARDRGKALGIAYAGVGLGDFLLFSLLGALVQHAGWRCAYLAAGLIAALGAVLFLLLSRSMTGLGQPADRPRAPGEAHDARGMKPYRCAAFYFLWMAALTASVLDFVVFQHVVPYLVTEGYTESAAGLLLGLAALGYIAGQLGAGALSDRVGRESVGIVSAPAFAAGLCGLWLLPSTWLVAVSIAVLGVSVGSVIGCRSAAQGDLFAGAGLGRVSGLIQVASALGAALGTWLGGFSFDLTGSYGLTFAAAGIGAGVWAVALWCAAPRRARPEQASLAARR